MVILAPQNISNSSAGTVSATPRPFPALQAGSRQVEWYNEDMLMPASKSPLLEQCFVRYTRHYLRRNFCAIHLLGDPPRFTDDGQSPLLVCLNHSSWWDVLLGLYVETELFGWEAYTVMDARQLSRYRFLNRLGVIGVDRSSLAGAKEFLHYAENLLKDRRRALWITPQGAMLSNHQRPIVFQPGVSHLAVHLGDFYLAHVTFHYEFWQDRMPEAFVSISPVEKVRVCRETNDRKAFLHAQEHIQEAQLDALLKHVEQRDPAPFRTLLRGKGGISTTYDMFRATTAKLRGEAFTPEHGQVITPQWKNRRQL
jgi:1-acyl-sn-glycerol-3-phosphate acyltransferase